MENDETAQLVSVGGEWIPCISTYRVDEEDVHSSDSGRGDETGLMHINRVREKVKKVFITCKGTQEQISAIRASLSDLELEMSIFLPDSGDYYDGTFYVSKISSGLITLGPETFWTCNFNAIEF